MNTSNDELRMPNEMKTAPSETYFETLVKMPLNRLLYEVLFGTKARSQSLYSPG